MATLGDNIRKYRKKNKLSQKQLQELSGIDQSNIARYENNKANPTIKTLRKIANALNVSTEKLLEEDSYHSQDNHMIGDNIRKYRKDRGWTQAEFAYKCGMSKSTISNIERGINIPNEETLKNIAYDVDASPEELGLMYYYSYTPEQLEVMGVSDDDFNHTPAEIKEFEEENEFEDKITHIVYDLYKIVNNGFYDYPYELQLIAYTLDLNDEGLQKTLDYMSMLKQIDQYKKKEK